MENKITVCVADADQAYRTELCDFLKKQGDICLIGDTADGREALAMVEAQHPAVLVLDTVLPGLDGTGILRRLKGKSETRCIVVTEFRTAEAARSCAKPDAARKLGNLVTAIAYGWNKEEQKPYDYTQGHL